MKGISLPKPLGIKGPQPGLAVSSEGIRGGGESGDDVYTDAPLPDRASVARTSSFSCALAITDLKRYNISFLKRERRPSRSWPCLHLATWESGHDPAFSTHAGVPGSGKDSDPASTVLGIQKSTGHRQCLPLLGSASDFVIDGSSTWECLGLSCTPWAGLRCSGAGIIFFRVYVIK